MLDFLLDSITVDVTLFVTLVLLTTLYLSTSGRRKFWPPGPPGAPIIGVLPLLTDRPDKKILVKFFEN